MTDALLHLVRHAEPDHGSTPGSGGESYTAVLTARGVAQADALGARLGASGVDAVLHGPLPRAGQTAQRLAAAAGGIPLGVCAHLDDRTPLPGDLADVPAAFHRFVHAAREAGGDDIDPDGAALQRSVTAFSAHALPGTLAVCLDVPVAAGPGGPLRVVLVTHAFVVGWFVRHALDAPAWRWMGLNPSHASLTTLLVRDGLPTTLLAFDDLAHLPGDLRSGVVVPRP